MKKLLLFVFATLLFWQLIHAYNTLVTQQEQVEKSWAQVESMIQRKIDLLPNLVSVVQKYTSHEKELLTTITALRSKAQQTLKNATPTKAMQLNKTLQNSLTQLFFSVENYPQLASNEQFLELQAQIEGSENRINVARINYNDAVGNFNANLQKFPYFLVAKLMGLQPKPYFQATKEAHKPYHIKI